MGGVCRQFAKHIREGIYIRGGDNQSQAVRGRVPGKVGVWQTQSNGSGAADRKPVTACVSAAFPRVLFSKIFVRSCLVFCSPFCTPDLLTYTVSAESSPIKTDHGAGKVRLVKVEGRGCKQFPGWRALYGAPSHSWESCCCCSVYIWSIIHRVSSILIPALQYVCPLHLLFPIPAFRPFFFCTRSRTSLCLPLPARFGSGPLQMVRYTTLGCRPRFLARVRAASRTSRAPPSAPPGSVRRRGAATTTPDRRLVWPDHLAEVFLGGKIHCRSGA